jgi:phosphate-selective porin OprO and OprP
VVRNQAAQAAAQVAAQVTAQVTATRGNAKAMETKGHEFGFESADGRNSIYFTGRVHFDTGAYFDYSRAGFAGNGAPLRLQDGENFRRARIGVVGQFADDWNYGLIYDFGGSSDSLVNVNSGSLTSGIENAYVIYNGFYKHSSFPIAIDIGAIDVPWTLDESISSNDIMFMERSLAQVIAASFGGGDFRSAFGIRSNNDRYYFGAYLTGPTTGALHIYGPGTAACTNSVATPVVVPPGDCDGPNMAALVRGSYQVWSDSVSNIHIGFNFADEFRPRTGAAAGTSVPGNASAISLSDRPELRIDSTAFLGTGTIQANSGYVFGAEFAAQHENAYLQGEYYHYTIDQRGVGATSAGSNLNFNGGYVQASYTFGGKRFYKPAAGSYTGVVPEHYLSWSENGWGALEVAARYSVIDLNDGPTNIACPASTAVTVARVCGGNQQSIALGLNYYPNLNMRFMFDLEHVDVSVPIGSKTAKSASFDTIAARTQINF